MSQLPRSVLLPGMSREAWCDSAAGAALPICSSQTGTSGGRSCISTLLCSQVSDGECDQSAALCTGAVWGRVQVSDWWGWNPEQDNVQVHLLRTMVSKSGPTRCDQKVPRVIFLLGCGYTSGQSCLQGGVLELPLSLGQGMVPGHLPVLCELRLKRVVYLRLVIISAAEGMALVCGNKHAAGSRVRWKLYGANHHGWRDVGLRVWPEEETSVFAVEVCWFPEAKESTPGAVINESHAHCFLWYGGHCSLWVCSTKPNCKTTVLSTSFETSETCCFSQEATETGGGVLGGTSRQCTSTHSTFHPGIFGKSW